MPVRFVGKESFFHGKSIYEIARNLKNFGVGRIVVRTSFNQRYPEKSFYRLTSVIPEMNASGYSKGVAYGDKVFRGKQMGICKIESGHKHDWRLIPIDEEHSYINSILQQPPEKLAISATRKIPPLMEIIFRGELIAENIKFNDSKFLAESHVVEGKFNKTVLEKSVKKADSVPV